MTEPGVTDIYRRQILTSKTYPRDVRVNVGLMPVTLAQLLDHRPALSQRLQIS